MSKTASENPKNLSVKTKKPRKEPFGRPTLFKTEYVDQVYLLCKKGFTDKQLAEFFNVTEQTLNNWKYEHPDFFGSLTRGKDEFDAEEVETAFLKRAKGFEYFEDTIIRKPNGQTEIKKIKKYMPPDTTAAFLWLKNRNPKRWRDKQELEHSGEIRTSGVLVVPAKMSKEEWEKSQNKT